MGVAIPDDVGEWADRLQTRVNDRAAFRDAAAGFGAAVLFVVAPDDAYDGPPRTLTVVVDDGACVAAAGRDASADYDVALRGAYSAWRDLLEGEMGVASAMLGERFEVEGATATLLGHRDALGELLRAARAVETEFPH